jgi:hypothetical protein
VALSVSVAQRKAKQILPNGETKRRRQLRFGRTDWVNGRTAQARGKSAVGEQCEQGMQLVSDDDCQSSEQKCSSPSELQLEAASTASLATALVWLHPAGETLFSEKESESAS